MKVRIASEASNCWSFVGPSEWRLWILIWISSWDPLKLRDAIRRTTSAPPRQNPRQGKTPKRAFATSSHHSNAPIKPESQSNLSKIVALFSAIMVSAGGLFSVSSMVTGNAKIGCLDRNCLHRQTTRKRGPSPIGHWRETGCSLGYASLNYCRGETFLSSSAFLEAALLRGVSSKPRTLSACRTCNLNSCTSRYIRPRFENFSGPFD